MRSTPDPQKAAQREQIQKDTEAFLASGGQIQQASGQVLDFARPHSWKELSGRRMGFTIRKEQAG